MMESDRAWRPRGASSVRQFCRDNNICPATFYNLLKRDEGPRIMRVGGRTLISDEAAADWRREREVAAETQRQERAEADEEWRRQREAEQAV